MPMHAYLSLLPDLNIWPYKKVLNIFITAYPDAFSTSNTNRHFNETIERIYLSICLSFSAIHASRLDTTLSLEFWSALTEARRDLAAASCSSLSFKTSSRFSICKMKKLLSLKWSIMLPSL